jgi:hypothetical protein
MKLILKASTLVLALGLGAPQAFAQAGPGYSVYGGHRGAYRGVAPGYGQHYGARPILGMRRWNYVRAHAFRPHRLAGYGLSGPRLAYGGYAPGPYYAYRPRVRYAYAETPYAYDIPQETYATGIFPTISAIGLHTYGYAYTTRVRPIAAYGGPTGSYAGGSPIYNRPLAPAYPTPGCDCEY